MNEVQTVVYSFGGSVIVLLLTVIGFFLRRLVSSIDKMRDSIDDLKTEFAEQNMKLRNFNDQCQRTHIVVNDLVKDHELRLRKAENLLGID